MGLVSELGLATVVLFGGRVQYIGREEGRDMFHITNLADKIFL